MSSICSGRSMGKPTTLKNFLMAALAAGLLALAPHFARNLWRSSLMILIVLLLSSLQYRALLVVLLPVLSSIFEASQ